MYLLVTRNGQLSLEKKDNNRTFSIVGEEHGFALKHFSTIGTPPEERYYCLDADAVVDLSGRADDRQWIEGSWDMLAKVETNEYFDIEERRVKAYLEQRQC